MWSCSSMPTAGVGTRTTVTSSLRREVLLRLSGALTHRAGDDGERSAPRALVLWPPFGPGHDCHRRDQHLADHGIVLGPGAVGDVAGAEGGKRGDDRVEV